MEDWRSDIRLSKPEVSDGFLLDLDARDLGGLVRELDWLGWLFSDELEDAVDSEEA